MARVTEQTIAHPAISELEIYPLQEALRRLGIGRAAYRSAVRQGLQTIHRLGRTFISGREIVRFLTDGETGDGGRDLGTA